MKEGQAKAGFGVLNSLGWIQEIKTDDRYDKVAADFLAVSEKKESCLVVCATWRECDAVTEYLRGHLKTNELLAAEARSGSGATPREWAPPASSSERGCQ